MSKPYSKSRGSGVIYELIAEGAYVKVSAIDIATGTEVSIVGDKSFGSKMLQHQANIKLQRMLGKQKNKNKPTTNNSKRSDPPSGWDL